MGKANDVLLAISTSENFENILLAAKTTRAKNMALIGLTGASGGKLAPLCDVLIDVPSNDVASIKEVHPPIYHEICRQLEAHYFTA